MRPVAMTSPVILNRAAQNPQTVFPEVAVWGFSRIHVSFYAHVRMLAYRGRTEVMLSAFLPKHPKAHDDRSLVS